MRQAENKPDDWLTIDKALVRHFHFKPYELDELTVSEVWLLIQVLNDMANENGQRDDSLLPHFADQAKEQLDRQVKRAVAYDALTPQEKLDLARILYG